MLREEPGAADLLASAREVLLNELLPALPPDKAFRRSPMNLTACTVG